MEQKDTCFVVHLWLIEALQAIVWKMPKNLK